MNDYLRRDHLGSKLSSRAARGAAVTMGAQWFRFVLQTGSTVVLARLLTPDDYGLLGMVLVITGLANRFKDLGLSAATIQRDELEHGQVSALFWINSGIGLVLAVAIGTASPLIAAFFDRSELVPISIALSLTFVMSGLSVQHQALLKRQMEFRSLAMIEVVAMIAGVAVAVISAAAGAGYWALVAYHVAMPATILVLSWSYCRWRPSRPRRGTELRSLLAFGGNLSLFSLLNYASRNADNLLIGRVHGAAELGLYSKAYQLLLLPIGQVNTPIANVAIPTLSYLQDDPPRYRRYYASAITTIALLTIPGIFLLAVLSEEVVLIVLGDQWIAAADIFRVLAFAAIAQSISNANGWIYVSTGNTARMAKWALFSRPLVVAAIALGLSGGAYGVAVWYSGVTIALLIPSFAVAVKDTPLSLRDIWAAARPPLVIGMATFGVGIGALGLLADASIIARTLGTGLAGGSTAIGLAFAWPSVRSHLKTMYAALRRKAGIGREPAPQTTQ